MKRDSFKSIILLLLVCYAANGFAAENATDQAKTKKEAEAKGYVFLADRDEIVAKAKKEGSLRLISSMERETAKAATAGFMKNIRSSSFQSARGPVPIPRNAFSWKSRAADPSSGILSS